MTDAPRISDAEVTYALQFMAADVSHPGQRECMKRALADFLRLRTPAPMPVCDIESGRYNELERVRGFNACIDQVLRGGVMSFKVWTGPPRDDGRVEYTYWTPTTALRWMGRELQQKWTGSNGKSEWRLVPDADGEVE